LRSAGEKFSRPNSWRPGAYALANAPGFPGIHEVVGGDRAISADTAVRVEVFRPAPAQFWLNLQDDYDLWLALGGGVDRKTKPRKAAYSRELTGTR